MPELPEVEVVRAGIEKLVVGHAIATVAVGHPRPVRRHLAGPQDFADQLVGHRVVGARRRGKYLWLPLDNGDALLAHLGMSGQFVVVPTEHPDEPHLRVRFTFTDQPDWELRFVDQRMFGGLSISPGGAELPAEIVHIARDPIDPEFADDDFVAALRRRRTGVKRALLDQRLISGVGNIYADEALWRARLHYARATDTLRRTEARTLLAEIRTVMNAALAAGGTSFDSLYINVNGESGYFARSLSVYGREGEPCERCGNAVRRDPFMNRSSFTCPRCQPRPRRGRW
ncbi:formamidopyrimidine-DNA glycosylase [Actinopolymorpha cephalotaxi]|uniref:Formamidopyrimidine-DNA glycosylase n=1 Tax=Actinopolymorpha cephalotaxi TaxID=504797 RepID=A0A1I3AM97_9ACTN|nr:bifunctional DNA-formamidopyrimidine glycosylase/DNA-(apurinic or apyrimidinic site) lyase [Actinopolymorpha cephalotaxi]NYH82202.1 formamidopyrimidine-DNA glycosylase [Actinopolymorpha cephalotaxi]SFH50481.1 formamidopyrimidine-DNA glycosylase [Actinopolymorpha cephalotaxi]